MKSAFEAVKKSIFDRDGVEDRVVVKKRLRPNKRLHRKQLKSMIKWDQTPVVAYK